MRAPSDILVEFVTPDGDGVLIVIVEDNVTTLPTAIIRVDSNDGPVVAPQQRRESLRLEKPGQVL